MTLSKKLKFGGGTGGRGVEVGGTGGRGVVMGGAGISSTSISSSDCGREEGTISMSISSANVNIFFPTPFPPVALRFSGRVGVF